MAFILETVMPELLSKGAAVEAGQIFKRRLAELKFRIEQQKLHREDIRDLVELTVGRMDIYHLVGALLLGFTIDFYCENAMLAELHLHNSMPRWLVTLFLVSNFSGAGFLLFAVWLAMHASVSAHSVGVRLLTSYARLSIPNRAELKKIQQPVAPLMTRLGFGGDGAGHADITLGHNVKDAGRARAGTSDMQLMEMKKEGTMTLKEEVAEHKKRKTVRIAATRDLSQFQQLERSQQLSSSSGGAAAMAAAAAAPAAGRAAPSPWGNSASAAPSPWGALAGADLDASAEPRSALRASEVSAPRWSMENSRDVCGLGEEAEFKGTAELLTDFTSVSKAVDYLNESNHQTHKGNVVVFSNNKQRYFMLYPTEPDRRSRKKSVVFSDTKGLRLSEQRDIELGSKIRAIKGQAAAGRSSTGGEVEMAEMGREAWSGDGTESTLSMDYGTEMKKTRSIKDDLDGDQISDDLMDGGEHFRRYKAEQRTWLLYDGYCRVCMYLGVQQLLQALSYYIVGVVGKKSTALACISLAGIQLIQNFMKRLDMTPDEGGRRLTASLRYGVLQVLPPSTAVLIIWIRPLMGNDQQDLHTVWYAAPLFILHALFLLNVLNYLQPHLTTNALPTKLRTINYINVLEHVGEKKKRNTRREGVVLSFVGQEGASGSKRSNPDVRGKSSGRGSIASNLPPTPQLTSGPVVAVAPDDLPGRTVRNFSLGLIACWILGAVFHILVIFGWDLDYQAHFVEPERWPNGNEDPIDLRSLQVSWPQPANLFEVGALHCSHAGVQVGSRFGLYSAHMSPRGTGEPVVGSLAPVARSSVAAVLCESPGDACQVLRRGGAGADARWELAPMQPSTDGRPSVELPLPGEWRLVSAAWAEPKKCPNARGLLCDSAVFAGWSGGEVTIADGVRNAGGAWRVRPRFAVHPRLAPVPAAPLLGPGLGDHPGGNYGEVAALQLSSSGRVLTVLLQSGAVDGWDLQTGARLGRWRARLSKEASSAAVDGAAAMCHDGRELWVAHNSASGPVLGLASLPAILGGHEPVGQTSLTS